MEITDMTIAVEFPVRADVAEVWEVLSDIPRMAAFSPECQQASWVTDFSAMAGARFKATNKMGDWTWDVIGQVVAATKPTSLSWVILGFDQVADKPSSVWKYELAPRADGGTLITHSFTHGDGGSHLVTMAESRPETAEALIEGRRQMLGANMTATLAAMAAELGWQV